MLGEHLNIRDELGIKKAYVILKHRLQLMLKDTDYYADIMYNTLTVTITVEVIGKYVKNYLIYSFNSDYKLQKEIKDWVGKDNELQKRIDKLVERVLNKEYVNTPVMLLEYIALEEVKHGK